MGAETTAYHRFWWQLKATVLNRVVSDLFVGLIVDANRTIATQMNPLMASDPDVLSDGPDNLNVGLGSVVRFDSRDFPQNAYRGVFLQLMHMPYLTFEGNHVGYSIVDFDYRHYLTISRPGSTLAWLVRWRRGIGDVPWSELSVLGSATDLRGYRGGRYRANTTASSIVEYRYMFIRGHSPDGSVQLSRHGVVGWLGAGVLGQAVLEPDGWLPNAGVGYRFEAQDRLNVRFDVGFGRDSQGVYFAFTEAF
jgi:hypothetical protein